MDVQAEQEVNVQAAIGLHLSPGSMKQESFLVVNEDSNHLIFIDKEHRGVQEGCFTFDGVYNLDTGQDKLFRERLQPLLDMIPLGYSVSLLVFEANRSGPPAQFPGFVLKVIEAVMQEPCLCTAQCLQTISFVQIYADGHAQDLLSSQNQALQAMDVPPLGLVVEEATEIVVADPQAAIHFYSQGTLLSRGCLQQSFQKPQKAMNLLTLTIERRAEDQGFQRAAVRILEFCGHEQSCPDLFPPLSCALSAEVLPVEADFLSWISKHLLKGNALTFALLCLTLPDFSGEEILSAILLTEQLRGMAKKVAPTHWDPAQEAQKRRASIRELRHQLFFGSQQEQNGVISRLGRALAELQVVKSQNWEKKKKTSAVHEVKDNYLGTERLSPSEMGSRDERGSQLSQDDMHQEKENAEDSSLLKCGDTSKVSPALVDADEGATEEKPLTNADEAAQACSPQWATQLDGETNASSLEEGGKQHLQDHHRLLLQMEAELARQEKVFQTYREYAEKQMDALEQRYRKLLQDSLRDAIIISAQKRRLQTQQQLDCREKATQTGLQALMQNHTES